MKERQIDPLCPRLVAMGMETGQEDQVFFQFDPPPRVSAHRINVLK